MNLITTEDIDSIALAVWEATCDKEDFDEREKAHIEIFNVLKEALDPWRAQPATLLCELDGDQEVITAEDYVQALEKAINWSQMKCLKMKPEEATP